MNLDQEDKKPLSTEKAPEKKKLTRKEKKALKKEAAQAKKSPAAPPTKKAATPPPAAAPAPKPAAAQKPEEVDAKLDPSPVEEIPPPKYTAWEKISPPARRKKQITTMESGFREVLGLVHSMRNNQEVLLDAFKKLPEAVDSVKKLADHSAQQSDLLKAMNDSMSTGAAGEFNKTLSSMDQTTQLLLERAQRSEERLYSMLRRTQRRIAFMTLMVLLLFLGAVAAGMFIFFPEKAQSLKDKFSKQETETTEVITPVITDKAEAPGIPVEDIFLSDDERSPIDQATDVALPVDETEELPEVTLPEPEAILEEVMEEASEAQAEVIEAISQVEGTKLEEVEAPAELVPEPVTEPLPETEAIEEPTVPEAE